MNAAQRAATRRAIAATAMCLGTALAAAALTRTDGHTGALVLAGLIVWGGARLMFTTRDQA